MRIVCALLLAVLVACGGGGDSGAELACRRFRDLAADARTLTYDDQLDRAQSVWDAAEVADDPVVRDAALRLAEGWVQGLPDDERADRVRAMDVACR